MVWAYYQKFYYHIQLQHPVDRSHNHHCYFILRHMHANIHNRIFTRVFVYNLSREESCFFWSRSVALVVQSAVNYYRQTCSREPIDISLEKVISSQVQQFYLWSGITSSCPFWAAGKALSRRLLWAHCPTGPSSYMASLLPKIPLYSTNVCHESAIQTSIFIFRTLTNTSSGCIHTTIACS